MNGNERSPVTELQVTACIFRSNYAFHLIATGVSVCPFSRGFFVQLTVLLLQGLEVTYAIFEILMMFRTQLPDAFHHLVPDDNFHCQMPLKKAKFDLFGS